MGLQAGVSVKAHIAAHLMAGMVSGVAGLLTFLIIHHFWIQPIWFVLPLGLVIATLGGLGAGWAYAELGPHLPPRPWTALALAGVIAIILLPSVLLAELRAPLYDVSVPGGRLTTTGGRATLVFILELPVTAALTGGLAGRLIGRTRRAALATLAAGLAFALGPGHNIPLLGGTPANVKGLMILLVIVSVSAVVLVEAQRVLSRAPPALNG